MRQLLIIFIFCFTSTGIFAQYYVLPTWAEDLPYSISGKEIYAIGISDPRMTDKVLAKDVALNRAITMAVMLDESHIYYASDYFEKKSEEYRWFTMKEDVEELGKVHAAAWVDDKSYEILETDENQNGETMVLIKYTPSTKQDSNFIVLAEYYRQDFEVSNTRAMETIRSIKLSSYWKKPESSDTLKSLFHLTNWNNSISTEISYNGTAITPPGYSYEYTPTIADTFNLKTYNSSTNLKKGLWVAYIDTYMQSIMKISKNYNSKMQTVFDDYKVNRDDGINEYSTESLARSTCKNVLNFEYGGMGINKNSLFTRIYIKNDREYYFSYGNAPSEGSVEIKPEKKRGLCKRIFGKKNNKN
jgi:hypothetical protein